MGRTCDDEPPTPFWECNLKYWLRGLFNPSPGSGFQAITDKKGRRYWYQERFTDSDLFFLDIYYRLERIGYANLMWNLPDTLELHDLCLNEIQQGRGLGSLLLGRVVALGVERGVKSVRGRIVERDLEAAQQRGFDLPDWYLRQGFTVELSEEERSVLTLHRLIL